MLQLCEFGPCKRRGAQHSRRRSRQDDADAPSRRCGCRPSICERSILLHQYVFDRVWCWAGHRTPSITTAVVLTPGARAALRSLPVRSLPSPTARDHNFGETFDKFLCFHARPIGSAATRPDLDNHVPLARYLTCSKALKQNLSPRSPIIDRR